MGFRELPAGAAWRHEHARQGFEAVFLSSDPPGYRLEGHTAAVEQGDVWAVRYVIELDEQWTTRTAQAWGRWRTGGSEVRVDVDGAGRWYVNGSAAAGLDGCVDVDFESSACTNSIPVHRLHLEVGQSAEVPAAYVRVVDLGVERLDQKYLRLDDDGSHQRYDYSSPGFDFECRLLYDEAGLLLEYPGIASRVA